MPEYADKILAMTNEIERLRDALWHAQVRFECLAEDLKDDDVHWAMCSTDAGLMAKALAPSNGMRESEAT